MNVNRAQEIIRSRSTIDVHYHGESVWIDGVDEQSATARIHARGNPNRIVTVPVDQLVEK